jgi:uncharacterized protein
LRYNAFNKRQERLFAVAMKILASDFYTYYKPSKCPLRVYLLEADHKPSPPGPLEELLVRLGERHEKHHLSTFPQVVDLSNLPFDERLERTRREIHKGAPVIYQGAFSSDCSGEAGSVTLRGQPDFLIRQGGGYLIRDCKLSRRINEDDHPDIIAQLQFYRYLFQSSSGIHPVRLEVFSGSKEVVQVDYEGDDRLLTRIRELEKIKIQPEEPYTPVGWSKCSGCGFFQRCWPLAEERRDAACVPGVTLNLSSALRDMGIATLDELLSRFTADKLAHVRVPHGDRLRRVGSSAEKIMVNARALATGAEIVTGRPDIPLSENYVMFDLEGLPPYLDDLDRIYLWGVKVMGDEPSEFMPALGGFGSDGDREGWEGFLRVCANIFDGYGDIPFVHWSSYERTKVRSYLDRYGDRDGVAGRVLDNLFDLLPAFRGSVSLPIPSYSLKVVEKYIGFNRTMGEYGGEWAIAKYIEAVETEDEVARMNIMGKIVEYNEEDLDATWAVMNWFRARLDKDGG